MTKATKQPTPVVTVALLLTNIAVAFFLVIQTGFVYDFGFNARKPSLLDAFTSLFMHQNVPHLLANMVFLAAVGPAVEAAAKAWRFAIVYLAGGLLGVLAHWVFAPKNESTFLIGASGCIAACIAYYNIRYVRLHVALAPKMGASILGVTAFWLLLQVIGAFKPIAGGTPAFWAHLGGFVAGLLLAVSFKAPKDAERQLGHAVVDRMDDRSPAAKLAATDLHLADHPGDVQALFKKSEALATLGDRDHEAEVLVEMLSKLPERDQPPVLARLIGIGQIRRVPSLRLTLLAEKFRAGNPELSKSLLLSVLGGDAKDPQRPEALLALATLLGKEEGAAYLEELAKDFDMHPAADLARTRGLL